MALQPRVIACGAKMATMGLLIRFIGGPMVMSATSMAVGLRGVRLHTAIVQVIHISSNLHRSLMINEAELNILMVNVYMLSSNLLSAITYMLYQKFSGSSSSRDSALCVCKGIWIAS